jgi:hypothetical protein
MISAPSSTAALFHILLGRDTDMAAFPAPDLAKFTFWRPFRSN